MLLVLRWGPHARASLARYAFSATCATAAATHVAAANRDALAVLLVLAWCCCCYCTALCGFCFNCICSIPVNSRLKAETYVLCLSMMLLYMHTS